MLTFFNACRELPDFTPDKLKVEGHVSDFITHQKIVNAEVQVLGWYKSLFYDDIFYSTPLDTGYTDSNGHFLINFEGNYKHGYSLSIYKERYFREDGLRGPVSSINNLNSGLLPHGYIKSHIINKITAARWMEVYFVPYLSSGQSVYRYEFINTSSLIRAFADSTFVTTTVGGLTNNLKILITSTNYSTDNVQVKDTSFSTLIHDTVYLRIIIK